MTTVDVNASVKYKVHIGKGLLADCGKMIASVVPAGKAAIISDDKVFPLYGKKVKKSLENAGFSAVEYIFPNGETSKNLHTFAEILEFLAEKKLTRTDIIVALGGGVVGDVAGFCAAVYLRGIKFVQLPTTILAACDSSVGGKTAVDLSHGKNLAGAFHQPSAVICDTETFKTLEKRQVSCGFAEIIKYGVIRDGELFAALCDNRRTLEEIITRCVEIKRDIVENDENDNGERKLLNFGHTLGHAVEKHSDFSLTHGEAVAVGMMMISEICEKAGICRGITESLAELLNKYSLPTKYKITKEELISIAAGDKKVEGNSVTLVIPEKIGVCTLKKVSLSEFEDLISLIL